MIIQKIYFNFCCRVMTTGVVEYAFKTSSKEIIMVRNRGEQRGGRGEQGEQRRGSRGEEQGVSKFGAWKQWSKGV